MGDRQKTLFRWLAWATVLVALSQSLASCAKLEKVRLRFDPDSRGELTFTARMNLKEGVPKPLMDAIKNCDFTARQSRHGDDTLLDAVYEFSNWTVLGVNLDCMPADWSHREVNFAKETGLLYVTYKTTISLEQKTIYRPIETVAWQYFPPKDKEEREGSEKYTFGVPFFPLNLQIDVPGKIISINNMSELKSYSLKSSFDLNRGMISLSSSESYNQQKARLQPIVDALNADEDGPTAEAIRAIPVEKYKIVITSRTARFEIGTIVTVLGALFGSGVLVQAFVWARGRRKQEE